jgi:DNA-binding YbaB/EbfC family protein
MFGDLGRMMKVAADMKRRMPEVQAELEASEYVGEGGDGAVRATVNGKLRLLDVTIDPGALGNGHADAAALEDAIQAAVAAAQDEAADAATRAMRELTGGLSIPGMEGLI